MKRLLILVLAVVVTANDLKLGQRIATTEKECQRIYDLNKNWSVKYFNEQAAQYIDLYFICTDSLNEDKYKYIDQNKVDMSWYPSDTDKFPVDTYTGVVFVSKPPARKPEETAFMKKMLTDYLKKTSGTINPIYKLMNMQSEKGQEIVDKQVECDSLALKFIKNSDDKEAEKRHNDCIKDLNCLKERFMKEHLYSREVYQDFFPIMYKNRGTMIKTPPKLDKSSCEASDSKEASKSELEKWMRGVEYIGKKLTDAGETGSDLIQHLMRKGMIGGEKILSKKEVDDIMNDATSVEVLDDDGEDDGNENVYKIYGNVVMDKLAELESKGANAALSQLEKAKPVFDKVEKVASTTAGKLKQLEESKIKPAVEKTTEVLGEVKDGITTAGKVVKTVSSKVVNGSSDFVKKLNSHIQTDDKAGEDELHKKVPSDKSSFIDDFIQPEYLPEHYDESQGPTLLQLVKDMGKGDEGITDKMSEQELEDKIKALKSTAKKRIENLHLTKEEIQKSANIVKGVMHVLLTAAGQGAQADMKPNEVEKAKSLVDELVNYATAELINKGDKIDQDDEEEEDFAGEADRKEKNQFVSQEPLKDSGLPKENEPMKVPSVISTIPAEKQTTDQAVGETFGKEVKSTLEDSLDKVEEGDAKDNHGEVNTITLDDNKGEVQKSNSNNNGEAQKSNPEDNNDQVKKVKSEDTHNEINIGTLNQPSDQTVNGSEGKVEVSSLEDNHDNQDKGVPDGKKNELVNANLEDQVKIEKANDEQYEFIRGPEYTAVTVPE